MEYKYYPKNKKSLQKAIKAEVELQGCHADLNCIDTSAITDMSELFICDEDKHFNIVWNEFDGDISQWNVSNVKDMSYMFFGSLLLATFQNGMLVMSPIWNVCSVATKKQNFS